MSTTLLKVSNLKTYFDTDDGVVRAVNGVSFSLQRGETLGIVGESGSGKSVTNLSIMGLIPQPPGRIVAGEALFEDTDLLTLPSSQMRRLRGRKIAMIFQDPMTSLNPFLRISRQMTEGLQTHLGLSYSSARERALELLDLVGIADPVKRFSDYPHQFSGGMRQRVMIAMALSCDPDLLIADEPTTALDVTIQAQILALLKNIKAQRDMSVILITHDLGVIAGMADRVIVMYAGRIVEMGAVDAIFAAPLHPYTQGLLKSVPRIDAQQQSKLVPINGLPPDLINLDDRCAFLPRCDQATAVCRREVFPPLVELQPQRYVACWVRKQEGKKYGS